MKLDAKGYTLVELIVVTLIFLVVLGLVGRSFNAVLSQSSKVSRSEESNVEGVVGLEMLRHDLNQAGFGLPTEPYPAGAVSGEAATGISASLNDYPQATPPLSAPRPIVALERSTPGSCMSSTGQPDNQGYTLVPCSDYLSLKATNLGSSPAAQRWTYLTGAKLNTWASAADNPATNDSVVVLNSSVSPSATAVTLVPTPSGSFSYSFTPAAFANLTSQSLYAMPTVYGVGTGTLRMPFNRADYFVAKPPLASQMSGSCAPGTGVLYKAVVSQTDGTLTYYPLLDCVASMQVVFGWATDGTGMVTNLTNADGSTVVPGVSQGSLSTALLSPANASSTSAPTPTYLYNIRNNLKVVKLYILAQNGQVDPGYTSPSPIQVGMQPGENDTSEGAGFFASNSVTYTYDINAAGWQHYRWKVYRIIVTPKNLLVNQ